MKRKRTQFIKGFNGNDLLTPAPSMSCSLNNSAVLFSCRAGSWRQVVTRGSSFALSTPPNLITPVLFHQLLAPARCQSPECIPSSLGVWVLGLRALRAEEGWGDPLQRTLWGSPPGLSPAGGFCWPPYWAWLPVGRKTGKELAFFGSSWDLIRAFSIYRKRNAKVIPHKSSTCSSACKHINLKSSCLRYKPSTVTASD